LKIFGVLLILNLFATMALGSPNCVSLFQYKSRFDIQIDTGYTRRDLQVFRPDHFSPKKKYPILIYFHGTDHPVDMNQPIDAPFGLHYESQFIQKMTEAGYFVVAPKANLLFPYTFFGARAWEANIAPYSYDFSGTRDFALVKQLFEHLDSITGAQISTERIFLAGFSSGGYMSSRIANEPFFANKIAGIIVHSASYGTCLQGHCSIPSALPSWHPPTLLVSNKGDGIVPFETVIKYQKVLNSNDIPVTTLYQEGGEHSWIPENVEFIIQWLRNRP
jgi:poly(3-hydroxyoctanoate) depolymerase